MKKRTLGGLGKNEPKRTQTNPIKPNFKGKRNSCLPKLLVEHLPEIHFDYEAMVPQLNFCLFYRLLEMFQM